MFLMAVFSLSACEIEPEPQAGTIEAPNGGSCMELTGFEGLPGSAQKEIRASYDRAGLDFRAETSDGAELKCEWNDWAIGCWTKKGFVGCMKAGNGDWSCCADCHATSDD